MSLKAKITLALLMMSLAAIAIVGLTARTIMQERFDGYVVDRASRGFMREISQYYRTYGSWDEAIAEESFYAFVRRILPRYTFDDLPAPAEERRSRPEGEGPPRQRPEGERPGRRELPGEGAPERYFEFGGPPPPFAVTDLEGTLLIPTPMLAAGEQAPEAAMDRAREIVIDGEVVGLAVPLERVNLSEMEQQYLTAMNDAWLYSTILAVLFTIPIGLLLGNRLTQPIREMKEAMSAMSEGELRQTVNSSSADEVGQLADSFNTMSLKLADAYDELHASRTALDTQARLLQELSRTDELTGLLNRRGFHELVEALAVQGRRYDHEMSVAVLDIDHFKRINDRHSHAIGDAVLERSSSLLTSTLRETDVVGRYGGEEFVVAFPETGLEGAASLAERIRMRFENTNWGDLVGDTPVTISIGVHTLLPGESLKTALCRADERLYVAKGAGRNRMMV